MEGLVYINGSLVPGAEARVSVFDHGFLYGYALFETMRAYNGKIFLADRHLERLGHAAEVVGLDIAGIDLLRACRETLEANHLKEARIRLTVTNGASDVLPWINSPLEKNVVVAAQPYHPISSEKYEQGYRVKIASLKRCAQSLISSLKSTNYLINVMARMEAVREGLDEALLLNEGGIIVEGSVSNVFFVSGSELLTAPLESGVLPGVTRGLVTELAGELDINVVQKGMRFPEIPCCSEAFITASTIEIVPVVEIVDQSGEKLTVGNGRPGATTRKLMAAYKARVVKETEV